MKYWLVKSDPQNYSWDDLVRDGKTFWDGVRNYQARNFMKEMAVDDLVFVYHSQDGLAIQGIAKVTKGAYQDPTTDDDRWVAVDLAAVKPLNQIVSLDQMKASGKLNELLLIRNSRLSVMPVSDSESEEILNLAGG